MLRDFKLTNTENFILAYPGRAVHQVYRHRAAAHCRCGNCCGGPESSSLRTGGAVPGRRASNFRNWRTRSMPGREQDPVRTPPVPQGFADAGVLRADANRTLLHITSLIPTGEWGFVPGELPRFSDPLPLPKQGVRQNSYNGARYGHGFFIGEGGGIERMGGSGGWRTPTIHVGDSAVLQHLHVLHAGEMCFILPQLYSVYLFTGVLL